ncbi:Amidase [Neorhizobium galegae bv. officinalis]|uniref:Amidase n=1 Tax=Neorhizobium galegae bv. officinalis TaxID=323656 RepID=A0A0T7FHB5_NEOGA|nr:amidase [Neorhizobium galegae]CDZ34415.1 Amidase [Neorhizobium galegae bv. officinalis]
MQDDEITGLSATALSEAIHDGRASCAEVMTAYLGRIDRLNPAINAIVSLRSREELLTEATERDAELASGKSRGWMHGMPIAIKDLCEVKGIRCTYGSPIFADFVPEKDEVMVERIRAAGAIIIGKTNTPEQGLGSQSYNPVHGITRNPYDLTKTVGGSSGGAAAALSAHLLPVADGGDMMGSLRNPAAFNNVVGFRPSFGRVPSSLKLENFMGQLSVLGPMGRTVRDVAALLSTQAGYDPRDPLSLPTEDLTPDDSRDFSGARIAWLGDLGGYLPFEPGVLELCRATLPVFERIGCAVDEFVPDFDMDDLWRSWTTLRSWLTASGVRDNYDDPEKRTKMKPEIIWEIERGLDMTAREVHFASKRRSAWYQYLLTVFDRYDYLILPSAQVFPFDAETHWPREIGGRTMDTYHRWMEVVVAASMAGVPVAAMPAGFGANGLPAGIQIIGRPRADKAVLEIALAYEAATDWLDRRPKL